MLYNITLLAAQEPGGGSALLSMLLPFALMFGLLYLLIIRPQKKKEQQRQAMINNAQKNDQVLTSGGIYGVITHIKDNEVTLKIDEDSNVKIKLAKSAIVGVIKKAN